ncbi:MAG: hypothetical protein R6V06_07975, partial [Kiritimatiellia bacterium]
MLIGSNLKDYISIENAKYIGAALLILLGIFTIREGYKYKEDVTKGDEEKFKFNLHELVKVL